MSSCRVAISDTHPVMRGRSRSQLQCLESMNPGIPTTDASLDVSAILTGICALANVAAQNVKENHCGAPVRANEPTLPWILECKICAVGVLCTLDSKSVFQSKGPFYPCLTNLLLDVNFENLF